MGDINDINGSNINVDGAGFDYDSAAVQPEIPTHLNEVKLDKEGVKETDEFLFFLGSTGKAIKNSLADDGKVTTGDVFKFWEPARAAIPGLIGIGKIPAELNDLTDEEINKLSQTIISCEVLEGKAEQAVLEGIKLGNMIKDYIQKYFL